MSKSLCEADEIRILNFLHRAGAVIVASGWVSPTLVILDWHKAGDTTRAHREASPELAALADEFYGPFESEAVQPDKFESMYEALCVMLGADAEGNVPFYFRTFAHEESANWHLDDTPLAKLMPFPIFGLYMIREGDSYRYGDFLENVFCYPPEAESAPRNQYGQTVIEAFFDTLTGSDMEHMGDGVERVHYVDPDEMDADARFSARHEFESYALELEFTSDMMDMLGRENTSRYVSDTMDAMRDQLAAMATEDAEEWFRGNTVHPKAILTA